MFSKAETEAKDKLLDEVIESRLTLRNMYRNYFIQQQQQAQKAEGYFQPIIKNLLKASKYIKPENEEIKTFLKSNNVEYNFLSPEGELSFTKEPKTGRVRAYLGRNPKTWKEITFTPQKDVMKVEGKDKTFSKSNPVTWKLLEGIAPEELQLPSGKRMV